MSRDPNEVRIVAVDPVTLDVHGWVPQMETSETNEASRLIKMQVKLGALKRMTTDRGYLRKVLMASNMPVFHAPIPPEPVEVLDLVDLDETVPDEDAGGVVNDTSAEAAHSEQVGDARNMPARGTLASVEDDIANSLGGSAGEQNTGETPAAPLRKVAVKAR